MAIVLGGIGIERCHIVTDGLQCIRVSPDLKIHELSYFKF